jgi:trimeric autotransporter adhesin
MRRFFILIFLLFLVLPAVINIAGCSSNKSAAYCNNVGYGPKRTDIQTINLEPKITGISLAYGQKQQIGAATAYSCPPAESIGVSSFTYGSTNFQMVDISPTGNLCGGTWNRNSAGGTPDFTICTPPKGSDLDPSDPNYFPGGVVQITASAGGATSNTVAVYVHPRISSISIPTQTACVSQNQVLRDASGNVLPLSQETVVKDDLGNIIPSQYVGNLTFTPVDSTIVKIDPTGIATAVNPGSTAVTATLSQSSSAAGYFYTCPPASITLKWADGSDATIPKTVQQATPQPLNAIIQDINGVTLSGITLNYTSTNPTQIGVSSTGVVTSTFPGSSAINAICQPPTCNSSSINQIGLFGNGKPVVSNSVPVVTPGTASNYLWIAGTGSQSFVPLDLTTGTVGAAIRMPYYPNSMVLNQAGTSLYFGSYRELMIYSVPSNKLTKEDVTVPGVVLAVSPDGSKVLINDQIRQVLYLYNTSQGTSSTFGGVVTQAAFTPDSQTLYAAGPKTLYIYSNFTGWSTYDISATQAASTACMATNNLNSNYTSPGPPSPPYNPFCAPGIAVTVPSVGAFIAGSQTVAHAFCPDSSSPNPNFPLAAVVPANTEELAATNDGKHIFGVGGSPSTFYDIGITVPIGACPAGAQNIPASILLQKNLPASVASVNQIIADPNSGLAFVTYYSSAATSGAPLPYYQVGTSTLSSIPLAGGATSPVTGVFSPDNNIFFVGTDGDKFIHYLNVSDPTQTPVDYQQIDPKLVDGNGNPVTPQFLAVKPRATT